MGELGELGLLIERDKFKLLLLGRSRKREVVIKEVIKRYYYIHK